jgi:hypothetical protein
LGGGLALGAGGGRRMTANILTMLDLSTAHLSMATRAKLDEWAGTIDLTRKGVSADRPPIFLAASDYGWIVDASGDTTGLPDDLVQCMQYGDREGCTYIMFDADGETDDNLPTYDDSTSEKVPPLAGHEPEEDEAGEAAGPWPGLTVVPLTAGRILPHDITTAELATIRAALGYWRDGILYDRPADLEHEMTATDGGKLAPLTIDEIDALCERLNLGAA